MKHRPEGGAPLINGEETKPRKREKKKASLYRMATQQDHIHRRDTAFTRIPQATEEMKEGVDNQQYSQENLLATPISANQTKRQRK